MPSAKEIIRKPKKIKPMTAEAAGLGKSKVDDDSLWLWGRLEEFERRDLFNRNHSDLLSGMTTTMRRTVFRLAPPVSQWLIKFKKESK